MQQSTNSYSCTSAETKPVCWGFTNDRWYLCLSLRNHMVIGSFLKSIRSHLTPICILLTWQRNYKEKLIFACLWWQWYA